MDILEKILLAREKRVSDDAKRYDELDSDTCMCCHAHGPDMRSLFIDCFYEIQEVIDEAISISDQMENPPHTHKRGFYLRICKTCRSGLLAGLGEWWKKGVARRDVIKGSDGGDAYAPEGSIPVRICGVTKFLTPEEWASYQKSRSDNS